MSEREAVQQSIIQGLKDSPKFEKIKAEMKKFGKGFSRVVTAEIPNPGDRPTQIEVVIYQINNITINGSGPGVMKYVGAYESLIQVLGVLRK